MKAQRNLVLSRMYLSSVAKKAALVCQKEFKRRALPSLRVAKENTSKAKKLTKEMANFWKKFDKVEKAAKKSAQKELEVQRKREEEVREAKRQQRKLNFLLTQTELFAHFIAKKGGASTDGLIKLDPAPPSGHLQKKTSDKLIEEALLDDEENEEELRKRAMRLTAKAVEDQLQKTRIFDEEVQRRRNAAAVAESELMMAPELTLENQATNFAQTTSSAVSKKTPPTLTTPANLTGKKKDTLNGTVPLEFSQPRIFSGTLKAYQLQGMNWLTNLYDHGINGILADEMGLGKTIQTIAFLGHLAEEKDIWGPFLIIAPKSTLHNWYQEIIKFCPKFEVIPYWGTQADRTIIRKSWNPKFLHRENSPLHVVITSYSMIVQDEKHFKRVKWQYMIMDEAHALKSSQSNRWKILLGFNCRNRLLLTGTPIQNNMAELWALLHFIMPTFFDSHEEFNDWFSKDIESHAENKETSALNEQQIQRLHSILKPFMLRRIKKDVIHEMVSKEEVEVLCDLADRQKQLYQAIKSKISFSDLMKNSSHNDGAINHLVMQFRKVCNHPELFQRRGVESPFHFIAPNEHLFPSEPSSPDTTLVNRNPISLTLPKCLLLSLSSDATSTSDADGVFSARRHNNYGGFLDFDLKGRDHPVISKFSIFTPSYIYDSVYRSQSRSTSDQNSPKKSFSSSSSSTFSFVPFIGMSVEEISHLFTADPLLDVWQALRSSIYPRLSRQSLKHEIYFTEGCCTKEDTMFEGIAMDDASPGRQIFFKNLQRSLLLLRDIHSPLSVGQQYLPHHQYGGSIVSTICQSSTLTDGFFSKCPNIQVLLRSCSFYCERAKSPIINLECSSRRFSYYWNDMILDNSEIKKLLFGFCQTSKSLSTTLSPSPFLEVEEERLLELKRSHDTHQVLRTAILSYILQQQEQQQQQQQQEGQPQQVQQASQDLSGTPIVFVPSGSGVLSPVLRKIGSTDIHVPDFARLLCDSGKLRTFDGLMTRLKVEGHRVLIYSLMTKMIDILEDYMQYRHFKYHRLDGQTELGKRRDMVHDFQTRDETFAFLLSTRAGGLGINLTAADTVIFYDSDWNPTMDAQAMDRAHRLGQMRPVTVYRLITRGTIEERIIKRAQQKHNVLKLIETALPSI